MSLGTRQLTPFATLCVVIGIIAALTAPFIGREWHQILFGATVFASLATFIWIPIDKYGAREKWLRKLLGVKEPILHGHWIGRYRRDNDGERGVIRYNINQKLSGLHIRTIFPDDPGGESISVKLHQYHEDGMWRLSWIWDSETKSLLDGRFPENYFGCSIARVEVSSEYAEQLNVRYFTGRGPATYGTAEVAKDGTAKASSLSNMEKRPTSKIILKASSDGRPFICIELDKASVAQYLTQIKKMLGETVANAAIGNLLARNCGVYHMTVINPSEYEKLEGKIGEVLGKTVDFQKIGLGKASQQENSTYFCVCESVEIDGLREELSLPKSDLHITLAYFQSDIHDVDKGRESLI